MLKDKYNVTVNVYKTSNDQDKNEYGIVEAPVLIDTTKGRLIASSTSIEIDENLKAEIRYFNLYTPIRQWCYEQDIFFLIDNKKFYIKSPTQIYKNSIQTQHAETLIKYINDGKREDLHNITE